MNDFRCPPSLLAGLMRVANSGPSCYWRDEFYALKDRLLHQYATRDGYDLQVIEDKCWGEYGYECDEQCCKCDGTGIFRTRRIVLERWKWYGVVYHRPRPEIDVASIVPVSTLKGFVSHKHYHEQVRTRAAFALGRLCWRPILCECVKTEARSWYLFPETVSLPVLLYNVTGQSKYLGQIWREVHTIHANTVLQVTPTAPVTKVEVAIETDDVPF